MNKLELRAYEIFRKQKQRNTVADGREEFIKWGIVNYK